MHAITFCFLLLLLLLPEMKLGTKIQTTMPMIIKIIAAAINFDYFLILFFISLSIGFNRVLVFESKVFVTDKVTKFILKNSDYV